MSKNLFSKIKKMFVKAKTSQNSYSCNPMYGGLDGWREEIYKYAGGCEEDSMVTAIREHEAFEKYQKSMRPDFILKTKNDELIF